jgi:hypothetical protein
MQLTLKRRSFVFVTFFFFTSGMSFSLHTTSSGCSSFFLRFFILDDILLLLSLSLKKKKFGLFIRLQKSPCQESGESAAAHMVVDEREVESSGHS